MACQLKKEQFLDKFHTDDAITSGSLDVDNDFRTGWSGCRRLTTHEYINIMLAGSYWKIRRIE